jgi:hypothetical protein
MRISFSFCDGGQPLHNYFNAMTVEQLKNVLHAQAFRPFTIHMGDGRMFPVKHQDSVSHSPTGRTLIIYGNDDNFSILNLLLVTELEVHPSTKPGTAA